VIRIAAILLGIALAAGAAAALKMLDPSRQPVVLALQRADQSPVSQPEVVALLTEAVERDSANPYRWADLGQALADAKPSMLVGTDPHAY
jgi:hypothetical protein